MTNQDAEFLSENPGHLGTDGLIYHYTTQEGLIGIIEKQEWWATDLRFLNDSEEYKAGLITAREMGTECSAEAGEDGIKTVKYLDNLLRFEFAECPIFSISFTGPLKSFENAYSEIDDPGDRLNMWRGYASGGINYSVGLSPKEMITNVEGLDLQECSYLPDTKQEYLRWTMNEVGDLFNTTNAKRIAKVKGRLEESQAMDDMRSELDAGLPSILQNLKAQIASCKHEGFWEEREWRLTVAPSLNDDRVFYTSGRFGVTPRIGIRLEGPDGLLPIKRIVVGPSSHGTDAVKPLRGLLIKKGYTNVELSVSRIPYRNW